jgi:hypothetical protein
MSAGYTISMLNPEEFRPEFYVPQTNSAVSKTTTRSSTAQYSARDIFPRGSNAWHPIFGVEKLSNPRHAPERSGVAPQMFLGTYPVFSGDRQVLSWGNSCQPYNDSRAV